MGSPGDGVILASTRVRAITLRAKALPVTETLQRLLNDSEAARATRSAIGCEAAMEGLEASA